MEAKNAKQNILDATAGLKNVEDCLNNAFCSGKENAENLKEIEDTFEFVDDALIKAKKILSNYIE